MNVDARQVFADGGDSSETGSEAERAFLLEIVEDMVVDNKGLILSKNKSDKGPVGYRHI